MNNINFQQTGGFPLETDTLNFMQDAYKALQVIAALGGENYILSGCNSSGSSSLTDGYMVINGEVLPFRGGLIQSSVVISEDKQSRPFENGQVKDIFTIRYAQFGTGSESIAFASIARLKPLSAFKNLPTITSSAIDQDEENVLATAKAVKTLNDKINTHLPVGAIVIWSGKINAIPGGWALCDGRDGRPNLTDRFVLGAGNRYAVDNFGGHETITLTIAQMPRHGHVLPGGSVGQNYSADGGRSRNSNDASNPATSETGGNEPHDNMPPYYVLAYIIKI